MPELTALAIADPPERWEALGFALAGGAVQLGGITVLLGGHGAGITAWSLPAVDGLATLDPGPRPDPEPGATAAVGPLSAATAHPNGATGLDHVVVVTPDFDRTARALEHAGLVLKRVRDGGGFRQGFRRVGPAILELVEARGQDPAGPARFWGLVLVVADLDALNERLGDLLSKPKPAVQPGRRIATLRREAGLSCAVAFMDPDARR